MEEGWDTAKGRKKKDPDEMSRAQSDHQDTYR